jgi:RNA polymerase sigma-70 factor, ECF subfamily
MSGLSTPEPVWPRRTATATAPTERMRHGSTESVRRRRYVLAVQTDELYAIAKPITRRRGNKAGLTQQDCEDLLQDVFAKYLRAWPQGDTPANVAAWFETATANAIVDRIRAAERRPVAHPSGNDDEVDSLLDAVLRSPAIASAPAVRADLFSSIFALVPVEDARLLRRRYVDGHSAAELAEELGISVANVDQRTTRAKRKLRDALTARPDLMDELRAPHPHLY